MIGTDLCWAADGQDREDQPVSRPRTQIMAWRNFLPQGQGREFPLETRQQKLQRGEIMDR